MLSNHHGPRANGQQGSPKTSEDTDKTGPNPNVSSHRSYYQKRPNHLSHSSCTMGDPLSILLHRIHENDPTLTEVSLQRLPLRSVSRTDMRVVLEGLVQNRKVTSFEGWLPENDDCGVHRMLRHNQSLRRLYMSSCESPRLWKALLMGIRDSSSLQEVELGDASVLANEEIDLETCFLLGECLSKLQRAVLRGLSLPPDGAAAIATGLRRSQLRSLELHQIDCDPGSIGDILSACSTVEKLTIIDCDLGLDYEAKDHPLTSLLDQTKALRSLRILETDLSHAEVAALARGLVWNRTLQTLDLRGAQLGSMDMDVLSSALRHNEGVRRLRLEDNNINSEGFQHLVTALRVNATLVDLAVRCNPIDHCDGIEEIGSGLRSLDMSETNIGDRGATSIGRLLSRSRSLTELYLEGCIIGASGFHGICRGVAQSQSLRRLMLSHNRPGTCGVEAVSQMLQRNSSLHALSLSSCMLDDSCLPTLVHGLVQNSALHEVSLGFNSIGDDGCRALGRTLPHLSVASLELQFNEFGPAGLGYIADGLEKNVHLTKLFLLNSSLHDGICVKEALQRIAYYLILNRGGRRALSESVALELWPKVLEQANRDTLYHMLIQRPDLLAC